MVVEARVAPIVVAITIAVMISPTFNLRDMNSFV
jgi:hypothetical protein